MSNTPCPVCDSRSPQPAAVRMLTADERRQDLVVAARDTVREHMIYETTRKRGRITYTAR